MTGIPASTLTDHCTAQLSASFTKWLGRSLKKIYCSPASVIRNSPKISRHSPLWRTSCSGSAAPSELSSSAHLSRSLFLIVHIIADTRLYFNRCLFPASLVTMYAPWQKDLICLGYCRVLSTWKWLAHSRQ